MKNIHLVLMLALGLQLADAAEKDTSSDLAPEFSHLSKEVGLNVLSDEGDVQEIGNITPIGITGLFALLSHEDDSESVSQDSYEETWHEGMRLIEHLLAANYCLNAFPKRIQDTELFEQFVVDHARTLPGDHSLINYVNIHGCAQWWAYLPAYPDLLFVHYQKFTSAQVKCLYTLYNGAYANIAVPMEEIMAKKENPQETEDKDHSSSVDYSSSDEDIFEYIVPERTIAFHKEAFFNQILKKPAVQPQPQAVAVSNDERLDEIYKALCGDKAVDKVSDWDKTIELLIYKANSIYGLNMTPENLKNTEVFEQFIIDHALTLPGDHKVLEGVKVDGSASWFPTDPFNDYGFLVSYLSLTDEQREHLAETYNKAYETMAVPTKDIYKGAGIVGFSAPRGMMFRKDLFFKHVFAPAEKG